ncbi:MAG: hypothetical protein GX251_10680 [Firmicutes bacterium]|mgnify:CR=1 FL=1|nr:hypothetical protein [Bacillota bacterium]
MKRYAIIFILIMLVFTGFSHAKGLKGTIQLDLSQPPQAEEQDPVLEKYTEIMGEISITDQAYEVVENIRTTVEDVESIAMDVEVSEIRGQRIERMFFHLQGSMESKVVRVEFKEPSELRGYILVADQEKMESRMYQPINNQIAVRGLEDASKEVLSTLSISDLDTFFDFSQYSVEVLEVVEEDGVQDYLLEVDALDEILQVRVKSDSWFPHEISVYEGDVFVGTMTISNVVFNPELDKEELTKLPEAKEVRM